MRHPRLASWSLGLLAAVSSLGRAAAQTVDGPVVVVLTMTSGISQTVRAGSVLPAPFAVRATKQDGTALPGLPVQFAVNSCIEVPLQPPACPPDSLYGTFEGGVDYVFVTTDADGIAVAPRFTAGAIDGSYSVFPFFSSQSIDGIYYGHDFSSLPLFQITQVGGGAVPGALSVPALGVWQGLLASLLILLCGLRKASGRQGAA
jgi:hypothetical protein